MFYWIHDEDETRAAHQSEICEIGGGGGDSNKNKEASDALEDIHFTGMKKA
jgi:hypothetical protein